MSLTTLSFSQELTFHKNKSYAARNLGLVQKLNKSGDSLILESDKKIIRQVDILNDDYLESVDINSNKGKVNLKQLPIGNYVLQARIGRRRIVMFLEVKEDIDSNLNTAQIKNSNKENQVSRNDEVILNEDAMYYVVYESNSGLSSRRTMSLKYVSEIYNMISKIKLELKSDVAKHNNLYVYEIYNRSKFMTKQLRNPEYYKKKKSKLFNVSPIYSSDIDQAMIDQ